MGHGTPACRSDLSTPLSGPPTQTSRMAICAAVTECVAHAPPLPSLSPRGNSDRDRRPRACCALPFLRLRSRALDFASVSGRIGGVVHRGRSPPGGSPLLRHDDAMGNGGGAALGTLPRAGTTDTDRATHVSRSRQAILAGPGSGARRGRPVGCPRISPERPARTTPRQHRDSDRRVPRRLATGRSNHPLVNNSDDNSGERSVPMHGNSSLGTHTHLRHVDLARASLSDATCKGSAPVHNQIQQGPAQGNALPLE